MASETEITIQFAATAARHFFYFNQFGIHQTGELVELHFGYGPSQDVFGGLVIVVEKAMLETQKPSFVKYLKQIGLPGSPALGTSRVRDPHAVLFADTIGLARHGEMAEIVCHAVSWKAALDSTKAGKKETPGSVKAEPVALLRSDLELHRNWISLLYASNS